MSDVRRCDTCQAIGDGLLHGWWRLDNESAVVLEGHLAGPLDFCSWECLGAFVFEHADEVRDQHQQLRRLIDREP